VVVDAADAPARESRATLVHAATLEILDELGVADDTADAGTAGLVNNAGIADTGPIESRPPTDCVTCSTSTPSLRSP